METLLAIAGGGADDARGATIGFELLTAAPGPIIGDGRESATLATTLEAQPTGGDRLLEERSGGYSNATIGIASIGEREIEVGAAAIVVAALLGSWHDIEHLPFDSGRVGEIAKRHSVLPA